MEGVYLNGKRDSGSWEVFAVTCLSDIALSVLPVNGEWFKLHGCGICYAIGKNPAGG